MANMGNQQGNNLGGQQQGNNLGGQQQGGNLGSDRQRQGGMGTGIKENE